MPYKVILSDNLVFKNYTSSDTSEFKSVHCPDYRGMYTEPEIEENQFKNLSHQERNVIKSVADSDLIGDLPSEFRTGL